MAGFSSSLQGLEILGVFTRWMGLLCGVLTLIVWGCLLPGRQASLTFPSDFINDVNRLTWRKELFSFAPEVFVDIWTPFVMGTLSILCHFRAFSFHFITHDFARFFLWNLMLALFANLGYAGGIGIIVGSITLVTTIFSAIALLACNGDASLQLAFTKRQQSISF